MSNFRPMNDLKERILQLMKVKNLTQQQFAELIKISPASLSSIFNDRTKPTLKHVTAILESFPSVNTTWLINGIGEMFTSGGESSEEEDPLEGTLFYNPEVASPTPPVALTTKTGEKGESSKREVKTVAPPVKEVKVLETRTRQITEIRIFYDDQTWETFMPKK